MLPYRQPQKYFQEQALPLWRNSHKIAAILVEFGIVGFSRLITEVQLDTTYSSLRVLLFSFILQILMIFILLLFFSQTCPLWRWLKFETYILLTIWQLQRLFKPKLHSVLYIFKWQIIITVSNYKTCHICWKY